MGYEQFWSIWFGLAAFGGLALLLIMVRIAKAIEQIDWRLARMDQNSREVRPWPPRSRK